MIEKLLSPEVITAAASVVAAITAFVVAIVNGVRAVKLEKQIEAAKQRETYIVCPHCGKRPHLVRSLSVCPMAVSIIISMASLIY